MNGEIREYRELLRKKIIWRKKCKQIMDERTNIFSKKKNEITFNYFDI